MAVAGAYTLAQELGTAQEEKSDQEIQAALSRYEAKLKPAVLKRQKSGQRLAGWFVPKNHARIMVRDAGMRLTTSPLVSRLLRYRFAWTNTRKPKSSFCRA